MALTGPFTFRGLQIQNVYVQARQIALFQKLRARCQCLIWASQDESRNEFSHPLDALIIDFELTDISTPIYDAAYAALKMMPQFQGFTDC